MVAWVRALRVGHAEAAFQGRGHAGALQEGAQGHIPKNTEHILKRFGPDDQVLGASGATDEAKLRQDLGHASSTQETGKALPA